VSPTIAGGAESAVKWRSSITGAALGLFLIVGWSAPAFAYGPVNQTSVAASSSTASPCSQVVITGSAFQPAESVTVLLSGTPVSYRTVVNLEGAFSDIVSIPRGTALGFHDVVGTGSTGDSASTLVRVDSGTCARLTLNPSVLKPGGTTVASGEGCPPGSQVFIDIGNQTVATTTANGDGAFSASIVAPAKLSGQATVSATCGPTQLTSLLTMVVTSTLSAPEAGAATFAVFVLLGFILLRGQFSTVLKRRRHPGASDVLDEEP